VQDVTRSGDWVPELVRVLRGENGILFEQSIASGATGTPVRFQWLRSLVLVELHVGVLSASKVDLAGVELAWEDEDGQPILTTGYEPSTLNGAFCVGGVQRYRRRKWREVELVVHHGRVHTFTVTNAGPNTIVPTLAFRVVPLKGDT